MKALTLKIEPEEEQYKTFDEMFKKWASLCNRYNRYTYKKKMDEKDIKEVLKPKKDTQIMQFSETQTNQKTKKDNTDLIRAMKESKKQKEKELEKLQERRNTINDALTKEECREINPQRPTNIKPKGWFKFHTFNYWVSEVKKLDKQTEKKQKTISKIEKGRIHFKPKRVGLWSNSFKISFKSGKLLLKPFANSNELSVDVITKPIQPHKGSSLRSKEFLERGIKDFLIFSLHSNFFGLANDEKYLITYNIIEERIIPKKNEKYKEDKVENAGFEEYNDRIKSFIDSIEMKIGRNLNTNEKEIIADEKESLWRKDNDLKQIFDIFDKLNELKKKSNLSQEEINAIKELENKARIKRSELLSSSFLELIKNLKKDLLKRKQELLNVKYEKITDKIKNLEDLIETKITDDDKKTILNDGKKAFLEPDKFNDYNFSNEYIRLLGKISEYLANKKEGVYSINKYPILFRKPTNKRKKIKNLKSYEWKYYIQFGYEPINKISLETKNIMGIDRGLTHLLAYSIFDPENNKFIINQLEPNPVSGWKWKMRKMRRSIQHLERRLRAQKGVHIHENQMKKRVGGIENKIDSLYHNVSRKIVNLAKEKNACIVFEDLEGQSLKQHGRKKTGRLRGLNYTLSLFDYGKIASLIKYKAELEGIDVWNINPAYTSQNCAKCILELENFTEPKTILYLDELKEGIELDKRLLEESTIESAKINKVNKKEIYLTGKDQYGKEVKLIIVIKWNKIIISKGYWKLKEQNNARTKSEFVADEEIAEFQTKKEGEMGKERIAILDYVYTRGKEIVNGGTKFTGNKKAGYCMKHGPIDADLNASRVIALCKRFNINNPKIWA